MLLYTTVNKGNIYLRQEVCDMSAETRPSVTRHVP